MKLQEMESVNPMLISGMVVMVVIIVAWLDFAVGDTYSLFLLYVFPIYIAGWILGKRAGIWTSLLCGISWIYVDFILNALSVSGTVLLFTALSRIAIFLIMGILFSGYRNLYDKVKMQAYYDEKTGALNYRAFLEFAQREIYRAKRDGSGLVLAYFDMDKFKEVNDQYGHSEGDRVLKSFSEIVQKNIRKTDLFSRIGGDEFLLLLTDSNTVHAIEILDRIRAAFSSEMQNRNLAVTVSVGVTTGFPPEKSLESIIHEADQQMYIAKRDGRNKLNISTGEPE